MNWQIDNEHSYVGFSVKHMMVSTVRGQFYNYTGNLSIDEDDLSRSVVSGEIDVSSIHTKNTQRDEHLRSADFFDVANFPKMTYQSTRVESQGDHRFKVYGDLTIRGIRREVVLDVEFAGQATDPWGNTRAGLSAQGSLNRKDFGLMWNTLLETGGVVVGDEVKIQLDIELIKQMAPVAVAAVEG